MAETTKVTFKRGLFANLPAEVSNGVIYVTTDERGMYVDIDGKRIRIGDFQEFGTLAALQANGNPSTTALYYITELNCLAKWDGTKYVQINLDTGMTSVEVTGTGNAVTGAVYDPVTRKLTLTAGAAYTTADDVSTQIAGKVGELKIGEETYNTVKEYVDKKTDGIASESALSELGDRVTAAEDGLDTLVGSDSGKSARTIASEELAKQLIPENAKESLDTLAEIAAWIQAHPDDASALNAAVSALQAKLSLGTYESEDGQVEYATVKAYVEAAIDALKIGDYAKAADLTAAVGRIAALEGDSHTHGNQEVLDGVTAEKVAAWDGMEQSAKEYTDEAMTWGTF